MKIAFARPGWSYSSTWVRCWSETLFYCMDKGISVIDCPASFHNIHMVRDQCLGVNMARKGQLPFDGEQDYDYIMWLDSDQVWTPEQLQMLIDADEDVVSGWYTLSGTNGQGVCIGWYDEAIMRSKGGMPCMNMDEVKKARVNSKGLVDLGSYNPQFDYPWIGMGFMLVKRGVFEKLEYPWFYDDNIRIGDIIANRGDDISFCKKLKEAGIRLYMHPGVRVGHEKMVIL